MVLVMVPIEAFAINMAGGITSVEESTNKSITYTVSDDGLTLTFRGSGKIGTDVIQALWTDAGVPLGNIENVVIGEEITALSGYSDSRSFLYSKQKVSILSTSRSIW